MTNIQLILLFGLLGFIGTAVLSTELLVIELKHHVVVECQWTEQVVEPPK